MPVAYIAMLISNVFICSIFFHCAYVLFATIVSILLGAFCFAGIHIDIVNCGLFCLIPVFYS